MDFQQDVKRALADHFGEFVTASESVTDSGLHVMRVVTTGKIAELSIDWVYYHVTDNQGRRALLRVTPTNRTWPTGSGRSTSRC